MKKELSYPTARDAGGNFELSLQVGKQKIFGGNVPEFLMEVIKFIDDHGYLEELTIPFMTSGKNYLLANKPEQKDGRVFSAYRLFISKDGGKQRIYVNTNHPRFFALRQGARLLEAVGFSVVYVSRQ